jgi:hypothetical protein
MSISWAAHRTRLLLIIFAAVLAVAGLLALTRAPRPAPVRMPSAGAAGRSR